MKTIRLSLAAAGAALSLAGLSTAHAGPFGSGGFGAYGGGGYGGGGHGGGGYGSYAEGGGYVPSGGHFHGRGHCAPVYRTHTVEVNRYTRCRTAYDHCGRPFTYHVTVVTYCDHYSNGTTRVWSRTFS
jgi:hypothetical protein